jgi:hypothetical protein
MFISHSTTLLTIFLLHTLIQAMKPNITSSMNLNPDDYLQAICYQSKWMQQSPASNVPAQQLLQQEYFISYQSVLQPG